MRKNYDFAKSKKNSYVKVLKKQLTIRLDGQTIDYFRELAGKTGMPYQSLMNLYLRDCAEHHRKLNIKWGT
jgi:uncharacterized protein (DUF4415 family)